jgi:hypothetical protein
MTGNAGFVHNGANGNAVLRWWPVIAFLLAQVAGAAIIGWQVTETRAEVKDIRAAMVTRAEWVWYQNLRADQIQGLREGQKAIESRLEQHMASRPITTGGTP